MTNSANICEAPPEEGHWRLIVVRTDCDVALRLVLRIKTMPKEGGGGERAWLVGLVRPINSHLLVLNLQGG